LVIILRYLGSIPPINVEKLDGAKAKTPEASAWDTSSAGEPSAKTPPAPTIDAFQQQQDVLCDLP
jgi:hypothetical protein